MGRLPKKVVDRIRELHQAGYLQTEIAKQLKVSRGSVSKYVRQWQKESEEGPTPPPPGVSPIVLELARSIFRLLADLSVAPFVDPDFLTQAADDEALQLMQKIGELDKNFARSLLSGNAYLELLKRDGVLDLTVSRDQLDQERLKQREKWLQLMKEVSPQALAQIVT